MLNKTPSVFMILEDFTDLILGSPTLVLIDAISTCLELCDIEIQHGAFFYFLHCFIDFYLDHS